jgi:DNA-binding response OmpR family regulator
VPVAVSQAPAQVRKPRMREPPRPVLCLIVENDPGIALDLADTLGHENWYVAGPFTRGREALKWLSRFTPDIAVVNSILGDGRGRDILSELRERKVPFILPLGRP